MFKTILVLLSISAFTVFAGAQTTFFVNSTSDSESDGCAVNVCTLREAVADANGTAGTDTINFDAAIFGVGATIVLSTNDIDITESVNIIQQTTTSLVGIQGPGTMSGQRVFTIANGANVSLTRLDITSGGGSTDGGAIANGTGTLTIDRSMIRGNTSTARGGGIANIGGTLNITNSTISGNTGSNGGGIFNDGATSLIGGVVNLTNTTISGNTTGNIGGGYYGFASLGAATLTCQDSTIAFNNAVNGGGIAVSSITGLNSTASIQNTIVGKNTASVGPDISSNPPLAGATPGTVTSTGYNLVQNTIDSGTTFLTTDQTDDDPLLLALSSNGALTFTHALQNIGGTSPAIDKGNTAQTTDQRGLPREVDFVTIAPQTGGDNSDIGAFELQNNNTAANVDIAGRVLALDSRAVPNVYLILTDSYGRQTLARTNPFGYFCFTNVSSGQSVIIQGFGKNLLIEPRLINVQDTIDNLIIIAAENSSPKRLR